jgi:small GTP-binding protein
MIQKKICMLGKPAVGKTSLVRRFVESIYSDKYLTTVGVKIDKKVVTVGEQKVMLLLWDIQGEDSAEDLRKSYLRGAAGYLLVADGTRPETLHKTLSIHTTARDTLGAVPFLLLINKSDLVDEWKIDEREISDLTERAWEVIRTSAKNGAGVEEAFCTLALKTLVPKD